MIDDLEYKFRARADFDGLGPDVLARVSNARISQKQQTRANTKPGLICKTVVATSSENRTYKYPHTDNEISPARSNIEN